ncbi:hypothetical protein IJJ12_02915 [bacterium]|nr:hypothetical protein [bacterium]
MPQTGEDLANQALSAVSADTAAELAQSEKIAETLTALQGVIEHNARELQDLSAKLKEKREMLKNQLDNNVEISEAEAEVKQVSDKLKQARAKAGNSQEVVDLKLQIAELNQSKKEIEETLSSHLINYHQLTGSTSFDTSDGDQWEFSINARVKAKKS